LFVKELGMVNLTKAAGEAARRIVQRERLLGYGLRIAIVGGALNGFEYTLSFCEEPTPSDHVFESQGFRLFVDPTSYIYLKGVTIDFVQSNEGEGFIFLSPISFSSWEESAVH
jgi:iron-sulfur cluster assembly accessory protein